ncbi:hypothetical protein GOP47_0003441 [Adiantum capillus-veneris]|uniref:RING-type E3 ubiquitin transferase n=1 Tax=Adiantum capillus-veneris TaxID=13818 RepID=A0A9D4VCG3_ADICA|nr:hypothetical protein GOP47_0003441 [Adiantum capillus-veneris]
MSAFTCSICLSGPDSPVVTCCGHLFCWACIYRWLNIHSHSSSPTCPVCKGFLTGPSDFTPLYVVDQNPPFTSSHGTNEADATDNKAHRQREFIDISIPPRPCARRKPQPDHEPAVAARLFPTNALFSTPMVLTEPANPPETYMDAHQPPQALYGAFAGVGIDVYTGFDDRVTRQSRPARRRRVPPVAGVCPIHNRPHIGVCPSQGNIAASVMTTASIEIYQPSN